MSSKILMPSGGQTTDEMVILNWYKKVGEFVKRGDILFEIETDKAVLTVESYAEGTLLEIKYPEGNMVKTGEIVAYIGDKNELTQRDEIIKPQILPLQPERQSTESKAVDIELLRAKPQFLNGDNKILASPLAKNLARKENVKLEDVAHYVSKNLLKKIDVESYLKNTHLTTSSTPEDDVYFVNTTAIRRTIARRMNESISVSPHYIVSTDVDMTEIISLRNTLNNDKDNGGYKISYNDIIMKLVARAVELYPLVNSSYEEDKIKMHRDVNFGLAIAIDGGIVVPVVSKVNKKSIGEIAKDSTGIIEKVKINKLPEADLRGGTITLSNLGMFGINNFTAIINQPQSCILAVGGIIKKVVVIGNAIAIRDIMNITGSFDHRAVDGAIGAAFMMSVKTHLEDPVLL